MTTLGYFKFKINEFKRRYPDTIHRFKLDKLSEREKEAILSETLLRLFWNTLNQNKDFPWEEWEEENLIGEWFEDYTLAENALDLDSIPEATDPDSFLFYDEVIDPVVVQLRKDIRLNRFQEDWNFEFHVFVQHFRGTFVMENHGDFRILDWYRLKEEYEGEESR